MNRGTNCRLHAQGVALVVVAVSHVASPLPAIAQEVDGGAAPVAVDSAGEVVALSFDWPVGLSAQIDFSQRRIARRGIGSDTLDMATTYRMRVEEHPRGLLMRTEGTEPMRLADSNADREVLMRDIMARLNSLVLSSVVSRDGTLLDVEGLGEMREAVRASLQPLIRDLGPVGPEFRRIMDQMMSDEVLFAAAEDDWNAIVGFWAGADLEIGWTYESQGEAPLPIYPDRTIPYDHEFSVLGRADCDTGDEMPTGECVHLHLVTRPNEAALAAAISEILPPLRVDGQQVGGPRMRLEVEHYVWLRAEPEGLLPHIIEMGSTVDTSGGPAGSASESEVTRLVYHYD
jgi:hypothetical protein